MKVLIVDDSRTYQKMLASYLLGMGFESVSAMSGEEALDVFQQTRPELILLDVNMTGMNGYQTARQLRKLGEEWAHWVPIIFLSASVGDQDIVNGIEAGGDDYLAKPISDIVLHAKIKAMKRIADHRHRALDVELALKKANKKLQRMTKSDGLTGIANKRYFIEYMKKQWSSCIKSGKPVSLLFIDVDHFKPYNDHYGHVKGDACLKKIAQALDAAVQRKVDIAFRYGGEEFAVVLPEMDHDAMCRMGHVMVQALRDLRLPHAYSDAADIVTVSVGGACMIPEPRDKPNSLISLADQGVYQAKGAGRNCFATVRTKVN